MWFGQHIHAVVLTDLSERNGKPVDKDIYLCVYKTLCGLDITLVLVNATRLCGLTCQKERQPVDKDIDLCLFPVCRANKESQEPQANREELVPL